MARMVSFIVLVAILLVIGAFFFKVMVGFLLPFFLAVLLVVMFRPIHHWMQRRCGSHDRIAAGLTTLLILLIFLVPLFFILLQAGVEGYSVYYRQGGADINYDGIQKQIQEIGRHVGFDLTPDQIQDGIKEILKRLQSWLAPFLLGMTQYVVHTIVGVCILVVSLYYFFADGQSMVGTITELSPLETGYLTELIQEFDNITRAVVLASVAAAIAQGLLTGIALFALDINAVFLLTFITMLFAMIPFVGATGVWLPCSLWLYFHDGRLVAAIGLAIYGMVVVGMVDNLLKPWILHGRSNLHPLLALLSVLGGVEALGPIGIFVGPMLVTFLYALLVMLRKELVRFSEEGIDLKGKGKATAEKA